MPKNLISYGVITKRIAARNSVSKNNINECNSIEKEYKVINSRLESGNVGYLNIIKNNCDKMLESLADSNTANKFKFYPLSVVEKLNKVDNKGYQLYADQVSENYCSKVLPYVEDISCIIECLSDFKLTQKQLSNILKEASIYSACDRVVNNYNIIGKRFNIEETVLRNKGNLKLATESVCSMIDTYNRESFQKMNICIEEMFYIIEKNNLPCNKSDIVNTIIEYFLLSSPDLNDRSFNGLKKCISESCFISEDDMSNVRYLFNNRDLSKEQASHIKEYIDSFFISSSKTKEEFEDTVTKCISSDIIDLTYNFKAILEFLVCIYKAENLISDTDLELSMNNIESKISSRIITLVNDAEISRDIFSSIIEDIITTTNDAKVYINSYPRLSNFVYHIKNIVDTIYPYLDFLYDKYNIQTITNIDNCSNDIPIKEGHIFRGHNLLVALRNLDRYLGAKCKDFTNKIFGKAKKATKDKGLSLRDKISNFLFTDEDKWLSQKLKKGAKNFEKMTDMMSLAFESVDISNINPYSYISEETHMFDMIFSSSPCNDEDIIEVQDFMTDICKDMNHLLEADYSLENFKVYYTISSNRVDLHLVEIHRFIFDEDTISNINEATHPDIEHAIEQLSLAESYAEFIDSINNKDIETSLFSYFSSNKSMTINKFDTILEALSLLGIDESIVSKFGSKYENNIYYTITEDTEMLTEQSKIETLVKEYKPIKNVPSDICLEAYLALDALLEYNYDDDDDDIEEDTKDELKSNATEDEKPLSPEEKDEIKKNPYKGINLKSIKLALLGLKSKFSRMTQKEKELSRNVDNAFKRLVDSFRNALISDSRESIIKGSVIPSFSKCLKIGIPAAIGISKGIINPGVAAIGALGSFALSKHVTKKERMLILDEIETELEVVEKEIQMAEREDDMKKYRALLQYKKNLQRQYQRIRYNVKLGRLPRANAGMSKDDDRNDY